MYEFKVENMSCGHCVRAITEAVRSVDGQAVVEVDLATKRVRVESAAAQLAFRDALSQAGYPVGG